MATDSTELTFVRCPSCRSLVPAVSTRCRMCGATLDASQRGEESKDQEQRRSGRVRQRTMSQPGSDLAAAAGRMRQEAPVEEEIFASTESAEAVEDTTPEETTDDPLSAYIEEVQVPEETAAAEPNPFGEELTEEQDPFDVPTNGVAETHEAADEAPVAFAEPPAPEPEPEPEPEPQPEPEAPAPVRMQAPVEPKPVEDPRPRVVVESGPRRQGKQGLSFGRPQERKEERRDDRREERREERREDRRDDRRRDDRREERRDMRERDDRREDRREERREDRRDDRRDNRQPERKPENRPQVEARPQRPMPPERPVVEELPAEPEMKAEEPAPATPVRKPEERPASGGVKREAAGAGRLCGWLVSFERPEGSAIELREGRFFVTGSSLKPSDLVLTHESVSTPHALVSALSGDSLRVQDLLSEGGVHIRRRQADAYQRISDAVSLEHGDWVRFGEVEFLVTLIPQK